MTGIAADSPPIDGVLIKETGEGRFQVKIQTAGEAFLADEPVSVGGDGTGPNPYELLAAGLGACTAMTLRLYAERKGWPLKRVEVRVLHRRDKLANRAASPERSPWRATSMKLSGADCWKLLTAVRCTSHSRGGPTW